MKRCITQDQPQPQTKVACTKSLYQTSQAKLTPKHQQGTKREFELRCTESRSSFNTVDFVPGPLFKRFNASNTSCYNEKSTLGYQFFSDHNIPNYTLRPYGNSFTPLSSADSASAGHANQGPSEEFIFYKNYKMLIYYSN